MKKNTIKNEINEVTKYQLSADEMVKYGEATKKVGDNNHLTIDDWLNIATLTTERDKKTADNVMLYVFELIAKQAIRKQYNVSGADIYRHMLADLDDPNTQDCVQVVAVEWYGGDEPRTTENRIKDCRRAVWRHLYNTQVRTYEHVYIDKMDGEIDGMPSTSIVDVTAEIDGIISGKYTVNSDKLNLLLNSKLSRCERTIIRLLSHGYTRETIRKHADVGTYKDGVFVPMPIATLDRRIRKIRQKAAKIKK